MKYAARAIVLILSFAINAQAQELTRDSPADVSVTTYQKHSVLFAVWASGLRGDDEWDYAEWYIDGWLEYTTPMSGQTDYVSWSKKFDTQGVYQVSVRGVYTPLDLTGDPFTEKISWTVSVNSTDPIVTRVSPDHNVTVELGSTEIFHFEARDPGGDLWRGIWYYDGVQVGESRLFGNTTDGQYPYTFDTPGTHEIKLVVRDSVSFTDEISWEVTVNQSIIVNHGGPYSGTVYQNIQFDGSGSNDPDGTIISYLWDFGDGSTDTGARASHAYTAIGNYTVVLVVTDNDGAIAYAETSASIGSIENRIPNADPGGPYRGHVGQAIQFDGSGSEDEGGTIVSYLWNFGDGTTDTGVNPSHTYTAVGQYTVTLTVTDDDGAIHAYSTTSSILNTPPVANHGGPYTGQVNVPVQFDGSGSTDLEENIISYHWYFGDENTGSGPNPTHTYTSAGTYTVTLTVTDYYYETDFVVTSAVISEIPNVLTLSVSILANSMSENGGFSQAIVTRSSGTSESLVVSLTSSDTSEATVPTSITIPAGSDSATFTVTAVDDAVLDGSQTITITAAAAGATGGMDFIEVLDDESNNQPPVADAGGPYSGYTVYLPVKLDGSGSYDSDGSIVSYEWDFGDGSFGAGVNLSHYYESSGEYIAILTVTDDAGQTNTDTTTVYIESLAPPESNPGGPYAGQVGEPIQFDGSGSYDPDGSIASYEWDFGDGTNATGAYPTHIYTAEGTYTVALEVFDDDSNWAKFTTTAVITQADNQPSDSNRYIDIAAGYDYSLAIKQDGSIVGWGNNEFGQADPPEGNDYVALAVCVDGGHHGLALRADGSIVGWGDNQYGQADPPAGHDFIAIAAGRKHSLALKSDGSIIAWGDNANGQISSPPGNDFIAIAAGTAHSLALKSDGSILAWGRNTFGQSDAPAGNGFVAITAAGQFSLALKTDGSIVAWGGKNTFGQASPPSGNDFVAVSAGKFHALALKSDGSIAGWGYDQYGQAGPPAGNDFIKTACGGRHSLALKYDGTIVGWGLNEYGQLTPPGKDDIIDIAAGYYHSLALKRDGSIIGWGDNEFGQSSPPAGNYFIAIAVGAQGNHSLALRSDGSIIGWGDNQYGQADPPAGNDFIAIAAGFRHSLALKSDGSIIAWGRNNFGQSTPPAGNDFVAIAAGTAHSLALKSDGSIVAWGRNAFGQSSPPAGNDFVAITAGEQFSLALKTDGSIVGWGGKNTYGQINPPAGNDFVAIAAGKFHALASKSDGSIVAWGSNTLNQAAPPAGFNFVIIAAGDSHSLAVKADGTIVGWGDNIGGQIDVPE